MPAIDIAANAANDHFAAKFDPRSCNALTSANAKPPSAERRFHPQLASTVNFVTCDDQDFAGLWLS